MKALRDAITSRYAGWAVVLLAGLAACQGVEFGVGVKPAVPLPDPAVAKQVEDAKAAVAEPERKAKERADRARAWTDDFATRVRPPREINSPGSVLRNTPSISRASSVRLRYCALGQVILDR